MGRKTFLLFGPLEAALGFAAYLAFYAAHGRQPFSSLAAYSASAVAHQAGALTFLGIVGGQVGCLISQREGSLPRRLSLRSNPWVARGLVFELALTLALVYVPGLNRLFSMNAVPLIWLLALPGCATVFILVDSIRRQLASGPRPRD